MDSVLFVVGFLPEFLAQSVATEERGGKSVPESFGAIGAGHEHQP